MKSKDIYNKTVRLNYISHAIDDLDQVHMMCKFDDDYTYDMDRLVLDAVSMLIDLRDRIENELREEFSKEEE